MIFSLKNWLQKGTLAALVAGSFLRIAVWAEGRSIFMDEANLIRNWLERRPAEMFSSLGYEQFCPPFFSLISKGWLSVAGVSELTVRALPLASGIGSLWLFFAIGRRFLGPFALFFACLFAASGHLFLQYSSECKQYATDGLVALGLVFLALKTAKNGLSRRKIGLFAVVGAAAIWLSMPSVFVLFGVGIFFFFEGQKREKTDWLGLLFLAASWAASFGVYFFKILKKDVAHPLLANAHRDFYLPFPPKNGVEVGRFFQILQDINSMAIGQTVVALVVGAVGLGLGIWRFWKNDRAVLGLFLAPIAATFAASAMHFYSMFGRLILFLIPLIQLLVFCGLDVLFQIKWIESDVKTSFRKVIVRSFWNLKNVASALIFACLLIAFAPYQRFWHFWRPLEVEWPDAEAAMLFLKKEARADEAIFADFEAAPAVRFYAEHVSEPIAVPNLTMKNYVCCDGDQREKAILELKKAGFERIWVIFPHPGRPAWLAPFLEKERAAVAREAFFYRAGVFLIQF